ncbi:hypothetical protein ACHQM5_010819 [Ranunculus cassubicifolius]
MHVPNQPESNSSLEIQISADNHSTAPKPQHGLVDQESSTLPVDLVDENDQLEDESQFHDAEFVDAPEELSIMSDERSVLESTFYVEPHEEPEESADIHQALEDGKHVR